MNCNEFEKLIPSFINDTMEENYYDSFLKHIKECNNCKEELEIHYMITVGLDLVEGDNTGSFNIPKALNEQLTRYENKADTNFKNELYKTIFYVLAQLGAIACVLLYFLI